MQEGGGTTADHTSVSDWRVAERLPTTRPCQIGGWRNDCRPHVQGAGCVFSKDLVLVDGPYRTTPSTVDYPSMVQHRQQSARHAIFATVEYAAKIASAPWLAAPAIFCSTYKKILTLFSLRENAPQPRAAPRPFSLHYSAIGSRVLYMGNCHYDNTLPSHESHVYAMLKFRQMRGVDGGDMVQGWTLTTTNRCRTA